MKTCLIRLNKDITSDKYETTLFLEDYLEAPYIKDARELTDKIFIENSNFIDQYEYKGYKITWSWYDNVYQTAINFLSIRKLIEKIEFFNPDEIVLIGIPSKYSKVLKKYFLSVDVKFSVEYKLIKYLQEFVFNLILLFITFISILFFSLRKGSSVAIRTEDLIFKNTKSDFRLNHLYVKFKENNVQSIEFIRNTSIRKFFINLYKRKRFAIYYTSIIYFVTLFTKKQILIKKPSNFSESVLFSFHHQNNSFINSMYFFEKILKILKINNFLLISFSSRCAHLAVSAKSLNIPVIGIMHGLSQKEYVVQEFIESYNEDKKIGCDIYGVWSPYYLEYFKKYSKISHLRSFQYSGLLRPVNFFNSKEIFKRVSNKKIKILLISEPLVNVSEIIPYLKSLLNHNDIEISIKIRPMIKDTYFEDMKLQLPEISNFKVYDCKIEDIVEDYDILLGSSSTAVIEASLLGKISVLLNTIKFGDYFDIDNLILDEPLLIREPEELYSNLLYRINNEEVLKTIPKIQNRFFGDNKDGTQWIIDQIS